MRRAELVMAVGLGLFSLYLMYLSQVPPLQIGWVPRKGPGSGAVPFWLSLGMLISCVFIFLRGYLRITPQGRSDDVYMDATAIRQFAISAGAIFMMLLLTEYIGAYFAILLFMLFYIRTVGGRSWALSLLVSVLFPVGVFFLFEAGMKILLPKGYAEPLFIPLYRLFVN
jgi:hypothetical protein